MERAKNVEETIEETFDGASKIADEVLDSAATENAVSSTETTEVPETEPETETEEVGEKAEETTEVPETEPETAPEEVGEKAEETTEVPETEPETETVADDETLQYWRVLDIIEAKNRYNHLACGRLLKGKDHIDENSLKEFYKEFSVYGPEDAEDAELLSLLKQMFNK